MKGRNGEHPQPLDGNTLYDITTLAAIRDEVQARRRESTDAQESRTPDSPSWWFHQGRQASLLALSQLLTVALDHADAEQARWALTREGLAAMEVAG